jgi:hypothetical protein
MNNENCFDVSFSAPDIYGEIHATLKMPLSIDEHVAYVNLKIDGSEPIRFHLYYGDAGTVGYSRMQGRYAISGRLSNVSMDWANPKEEDVFKIINVIGGLDNGNATLHLWAVK